MQLPLSLTAEGWYTANVSVGGRSARLAVDTGSETFWVRSAAIARNHTARAASFLALPRRRVQYLATAASFLARSPHFSVQYGRGAVDGEVRSESVQLQETVQKC